MKKNFQLFMFFLFTLLAALLIYMGNDIIVRFNELEAKVTAFEEDLHSMRGALNVVRNFKGVIEKEGKGVVMDDKGKERKIDEIKAAPGFYCSFSSEEAIILELSDKYQLKAWTLEGDQLKSFSRAIKPRAVGSYFIRGTNIYAVVTIETERQNRKLQILKVDDKGFATEVELSGKFLSYDSCPQSVQVAY